MAPDARLVRAAVPAAAPAVPVLLVVLPDCTATDRLPAAAEQARHDGARLLIALAQPRPGFTTDAAIAQRGAICAHEELLLLQRIAHRMLHGSGVGYDIVPMAYRDSRSATKRERRIAAATHDLSRRQGAILLPAPGTPAAGHELAPRPLSTGRSARHVVAVLADSAEAVRVARAAGDLAAALGLPLAMVVPVPIPAPSFNIDPLDPSDDNWISQDAAAIAGRVSPTLERLGLPARVFSAPYRTDGSAGAADQNFAAAIEDLARRLRAKAVVISAACPPLQHLRLTCDELHLIEPIAQDTLQNEARPVLDEDRVTGR